MNAKLKTHLSNIFVSQVNNERAIYSAKTYPWWVSIIMLIIGTFLPVIPIMGTQGKSSGAAFMNGTVYGFDQHIAQVSYDINQEQKYRFKTENYSLVAEKKNAEDKWEPYEQTYLGETPEDMTPIGYYDETYSIIVDDVEYKCKRRAFELYYTDRVYSSSATSLTVSSMVKTLLAQTYVVGETTPTKYTGQEEFKDSSFYTPSFVVLHKNGMLAYIFKSGTTTISSYTSSGYNWNHYATDNLFEDVATVVAVDANPLDANYVAGVRENWRYIFNKGYDNQKVKNFWSMSGLFYGIHVVLVLFMGFMLWLLTRGKNNPNRGLKVYTCFWIAGWICVAPAILAMILGFIWSMAQQIAFIALIGLRTMWLAMRQLNPRY